jgi:hypothetical protein
MRLGELPWDKALAIIRVAGYKVRVSVRSSNVGSKHGRATERANPPTRAAIEETRRIGKMPPPATLPANGSADGFYVCTQFVNDKVVWRTTVSARKTMTLNDKTYLLVPP